MACCFHSPTAIKLPIFKIKVELWHYTHTHTSVTVDLFLLLSHTFCMKYVSRWNMSLALTFQVSATGMKEKNFTTATRNRAGALRRKLWWCSLIYLFTLMIPLGDTRVSPFSKVYLWLHIIQIEQKNKTDCMSKSPFYSAFLTLKYFSSKGFTTFIHIQND